MILERERKSFYRQLSTLSSTHFLSLDDDSVSSKNSMNGKMETHQKWQPQQRKKKQSVETKTIPSKTETILNKKSSTTQLGKLKDTVFFHRSPELLLNLLHEQPFFPKLLNKNNKTLSLLLLLLLFSMPLLSLSKF